MLNSTIRYFRRRLKRGTAMLYKKWYKTLFCISFCIFSSLATVEQEVIKLFDSRDQKGGSSLSGPIHDYLTQRIAPAISLLPSLIEKKCFLPLPVQQLGIKHGEIKDFILKMEHDKSLVPLQIVWEKYLSHNFDQQTLFVRELLLTLISIFTHTANTLKNSSLSWEQLESEASSDITTSSSSSAHKPSLAHIVDLYFAIQNLPILQLLATLDDLVIQVKDILQVYELNGTLTWKQWLSRYWWTSPVVLFTCIQMGINAYQSFSMYRFKTPRPIASKQQRSDAPF